MGFTYNWLKQYVDFAWSPAELAEKLTFAGIERLAMVMWSINDIRLFTENGARFLEQL